MITTSVLNASNHFIEFDSRCQRLALIAGRQACNLHHRKIQQYSCCRQQPLVGIPSFSPSPPLTFIHSCHPRHHRSFLVASPLAIMSSLPAVGCFSTSPLSSNHNSVFLKRLFSSVVSSPSHSLSQRLLRQRCRSHGGIGGLVVKSIVAKTHRPSRKGTIAEIPNVKSAERVLRNRWSGCSYRKDCVLGAARLLPLKLRRRLEHSDQE